MEGAKALLQASSEESLLGLSPFGFHRVAYSEWGEPENSKTLICVHGLTRNRHDFDSVGRALASHYRIACPDVVGRGSSDWLADPTGYGYPQYMSDMSALIARLGVSGLDWLGTSMGGLIGMMLAAQRGTPIHRLILNDVGPWIPKAALERIAGYVGTRQVFSDLPAAEAYLRKVHAPFGNLSDEQWRLLTRHSVTDEEGKGLVLRYDPGIAMAFDEGPVKDVDLWDIWDRLSCPVLVLRGADSDLLTAEVAKEMTRRGPPTQLVEIAGCGHAPALMDEEQIEILTNWLIGD